MSWFGLGLGMDDPSEGGVIDPSAGYALYLPFSAASPTYRSGATTSNVISGMPGYAYTRSGAKQELLAGTSGVSSVFAANVPGIVSGQGYYSRAAVTNNTLNSSNLAGTGWVAASATATGNFALGPDGASNASRAQLGVAAQGNSVIYQPTAGTTTTRTGSMLVKSNTGSNQSFSISMTEGGVAAHNGPDMIATTNWQRFVVVQPFTTATSNCSFGIQGPAAGTAADIQVAFAQCIDGNFPDGGPIIATAGATVTNGADALAVSPPALTDQDMLIWVDWTPKETVASGFVSQYDNGTNDADSFIFFANGVTRVWVSTGLQHNDAGAAEAVGVRHTRILRRLSGNWRSGKIVAGVLTWAAAGGAGTFPTAVTTLRPGKDTLTASNVGQAHAGDFIKAGTFTTDAAVLAAVAGTGI